MANQPSFWLLNQRLGWRLVDESGNRAGDSPVIRLGAAPSGPLALDSPDGSLGGLILPRGMAIDSTGTVYLLGPSKPWVKRFDAATRKFVLVPSLGGKGEDARRFQLPASFAIAQDQLYIADQTNRRVVLLGLGDLALRQVWQRDWLPLDVASRERCAYILDAAHGRVYRHCAGHNRLNLVIDSPGSTSWERIAVDRDGRIYLFDATDHTLHIFDASGKPTGSASDNSEVSGRFEAPPIRLDYRKRFCVPESLASLCSRRSPNDRPPIEQPLSKCSAKAGLIFNLEGEPAVVEPAEAPGPAPYRSSEAWYSEALDSKIYQCQWHRIEVDVDALPAGTQLVVSTFTSASNGSTHPAADIADPNADYLWETRYAMAGPSPKKPGDSTAPKVEFLVQSHEGQYLWLRLQLKGDGFSSPSISQIRVHFPRKSYIRYLPAVYQTDDASRSFLERLLSIVQTQWDQIDSLIDGIAAYFDPKAVPPGGFLAYLSRWLALPLEGTWTEEQKRRLLAAAPVFYKRRGSIESLKSYLRVYLQNLSGASDAQMQLVSYPQILESFRERQYFMLSAGETGATGRLPLWGPGVTERCQLNVFSQVDDVRMVSTGDPEHDVFQQFAHRFRVFIPAAWVRDIEDERKIRRALDTEKPAHTQYDLCLVEPRFRVGVQSTVGINTVVGAWPVARLACHLNANEPTGLEPASRLGYDMVLGARPSLSRTFRLTPSTRLGIETTLN